MIRSDKIIYFMKKIILKKISILFVFSILVLLLGLKFFVFDFATTEDFGFAGLGVLLLIGFSLFGILLDYILSLFIKDRTALNMAELLIVLLFLFFIYLVVR